MDAARRQDFRTFLDAVPDPVAAPPPEAWPAMPPSFLSEPSAQAQESESRGYAVDAYLDVMADEEERPPEEPPSTEPGDVAASLGLLPGWSDRDFDRARRDFAKLNHPDRVPEHHRAAAMVRMQVANRMIDEAKAAWRAGRA